MNNISLNPRLEKIAELVPKCRTVADIGTDHAYIPVKLLLDGKTEYAIASDIKSGPVSRAESTAGKFGLSDKIDVRLGGGLSTVSPSEADVIVIAGMGGILISDILKASQTTVRSAQLLVLQPMTAVLELREYLSQNGYEVTEEHLVAEEEKIYNIIVAKPQSSCNYSMKELYLGKGLDKTSPRLFEEYQIRVISKLKKRVDGLEKSQREENIKEAEEISQIIRELEGSKSV